jgi:nitrate reductase gamma subunit
MFESLFDIGLLALVFYYLIGMIPSVLAAIDIMKARKDVKHKIVWLFICLVLGLIGVAIYCFIEKRKVASGP